MRLWGYEVVLGLLLGFEVMVLCLRGVNTSQIVNYCAQRGENEA